MAPETESVLEVEGVRKVFPKAAGDLVVLDDICLSVRSGEIVGLLGRSGSGKSTLLRAIAGLMPVTAGRVLYRGTPVSGPSPGIAMVFQNFALFPWLTVLGNVELGLHALGVPAREASRRALAAIDLIGLDGFETAYPRELSGGMRQRVGFARALVVEPTLLDPHPAVRDTVASLRARTPDERGWFHRLRRERWLFAARRQPSIVPCGSWIRSSARGAARMEASQVEQGQRRDPFSDRDRDRYALY